MAAPVKHGLAAALHRFEFLWVKDMFTVLQILRVNGSAGAPNRLPYQWLLANQASAGARSRLALKAFSAPATVVEADFAGLPDDQVREVRAFMDLRSWDDPVAGLPRKGKPGAGALTDRQRDLIEYIRRRRDVATVASGTVKDGKGLMRGGTPSADPDAHRRHRGLARIGDLEGARPRGRGERGQHLRRPGVHVGQGLEREDHAPGDRGRVLRRRSGRPRRADGGRLRRTARPIASGCS